MIPTASPPRRRRSRGLLVFAAVLALFTGGLVTVGATPAAADVSNPAWWNNTTCDTAHYTGSYALGASFNGVKACGPGPTQGGSDHLVNFYSGAWGEYEWECVELVMRYMYQVYGIAPYSSPGGKDVVANYSGNVLSKVTNNGVSTPTPGDILAFAASTNHPTYGHTAVVTAVTLNASGTGTVTYMQQNAGYDHRNPDVVDDGWGSVSVTNKVLGDSISGWLHNPNYVPPTPSAVFQSFVGDWNGDHIADIGLRDKAMGRFYVKYGPLYNWVDTNLWDNSVSSYQAFVGDFNGDTHYDVGLRNPISGWFGTHYGIDFTTQTATTWDNSVAGYQSFQGDFNGDHLVDIGLRNPISGLFLWRYGPDYGTQGTFQWDASVAGYQSFEGDFNGDHIVDVGLRNPISGLFLWRYGPSFTTQATFQWDASDPNYQSFMGDFNGDGQADAALRSANGWFYIRYGPDFTTQTAVQWDAG